MKMIKALMTICLMIIAISACKKDSGVIPSSGTPFTLKLTDAPGDYDEVNIDVQSVEIITAGTNGSTVLLNSNVGIFNLLDLANGNDTVITTGVLNAQTIEQVRLILGDGNTVVVNGISYPLETPSAQQSGLKLQLHETLQPGVAYAMTLDFDANQSIVQEGNGTYKLKPVIRVISTAITGSITGLIILPVGVLFNGTTIITASDGVNNYSSVIDAEGHFLIQGIPGGTYTIVIHPQIPYVDITIANVIVTTGEVTNVGEVVVN